MWKIFSLLSLFVSLQTYSQEKSLKICTVDCTGKPLGNTTVYLSNDSVTLNEKSLFLIAHSNWRYNKPSMFDLSNSDIRGECYFLKNGYSYIHVLRYGFESSTIKVDTAIHNYTITLRKKTYDFPSLNIYRDKSVVEWNHYGEEFDDTFVEYRFKPNEKVVKDGVEYEVEYAKAPENIIDSTYGWKLSPHVLPSLGIEGYLQKLSCQINAIRFKVIVIEFTLMKYGKPSIISIKGASEKQSNRVKDIFINTDTWKPANYFGQFEEVKYRLKIAKYKTRHNFY